MKRLTCEMCGSTDIMKENGVFVCQTCGTKYSVEEAKKMMVEIEGTVDVSGSTVKVDNTGLIDSYLQMAENALDSSNNAEAENYANKIIEITPNAYRAWFIKGKAAGWQTTGRNNRYPESIVNWINAYQFAPKDQKKALAEEIKIEAMSISTAILQMELNSFTNFRSEDNKKDIDKALSLINKQLKELKDKTGIDVYTDSFKTALARAVNGGMVSASNAADKDFGPENRNRDKFNWNKYTEAQDCCLSLLDSAYDLTSDDDLCLTICKNYIAIATQCRDSCSYTFQASAYSDGRYVKDYAFTSEAKKHRTKTINEWEARKSKHDPVARKDNCQKAQELVAETRGDEEKQMAIAQYWEEHSSERETLNKEKAELERRITQLQAHLNANADKLKMDKIDSYVSNLKGQISDLGVFKGKEKKALQAQIDDLNSKKSVFETRWNAAKKQNDELQEKVKARINAIENEFIKERGRAKIAPKTCLTLLNGDKFVPTAMQIVDYNRSAMPDGITVKGEGEGAVENYTRTLVIKTNTMLALFSALTGDNKPIGDLDSGYVDNPEENKAYRIRFVVDGKDSDAFLNFAGKTIHSVIEGYYYSLQEEKTPKKVADFIRIVSASIIGICPNIDIDALQEAIAEAAYGLKQEWETDSDGIIVTVKGSSKSNTTVTLKPKTTDSTLN